MFLLLLTQIKYRQKTFYILISETAVKPLSHLKNFTIYYFEQKKGQNFIKLMFQFRLIPTTNKLTRITQDTISAIDHKLTNAIINNKFKIAMFPADISDHFPIISAFKLKTKRDISKYKHIIYKNLIKAFKSRLHKILRGIIKSTKDPNESHKRSMAILTSAYQ